MTAIKHIIAENLRRNRRIARSVKAYDPLSGTGCCGERVLFRKHRIPAELRPLLSRRTTAEEYHSLRCRYDFEYWLATEVRYFSPQLNREITLRPSTLQRRLIALLESQRSQGAVFSYILHSSCEEVAPLLTLYLRWLQFYRTPGADTLTVSPTRAEALERLVESRSVAGLIGATTRRHYSRVEFEVPSVGARRRMINYQSSKFTTFRYPDALFGGVYNYTLITSASRCSFRSELKCDYSRLQRIASVASAGVSTDAGGIIVESSTSNFANRSVFHRLYREALELGPYTPYRTIFLPWHLSNRNVAPLPMGVAEYYNSLTSYELYLWDTLGLSLQQIEWRRRYLRRTGESEESLPATQGEALAEFVAPKRKRKSRCAYPKRQIKEAPKEEEKKSPFKAHELIWEEQAPFLSTESVWYIPDVSGVPSSGDIGDTLFRPPPER